MHLGKTGDVRLVEDRASRIEGLRRQAVADHADELNAHGGLLEDGEESLLVIEGSFFKTNAYKLPSPPPLVKFILGIT
ncbi:hypothetical protein D3C77_751380 [compost metagenome]